MPIAYTAAQIFTGTQWLNAHAVVCTNERVSALLPLADLTPDMELINLGAGMLAPALIDAQVYGAAGRLFSQYPTAATLQAMENAFAAQGTCLFQPTIATNTFETTQLAIQAVHDYRKNGGRAVHGLHLEGPWLNPQKAGAHHKNWMHTPTMEEVEVLLEAAAGAVTTITLAPEVCSGAVIDALLQAGIVLSAGHSNATYAQAMEAFDKGIGTVTHLYNAMSPLQHREPGLVGAVWQHHTVMSSIIPDGHHVSYAAIAIAKKLMGPRLFAITDAVTETSEGPYQHKKAGDKYECGGVLSGAAIGMHQAWLNLVHKVGIEYGEALRMCSLYPAKALGINEQYGMIAPGYPALFLSMQSDGTNPRLVTAPPAS